MLNVTTEKFDEEVLKSDRKVLVDFWAAWCGPCRAQAPILEQLAELHPEIKIVKVNVDEEPDLAARYDVSGIPTLMVFDNGKLVNRSVGLSPLALLETLL